MFRSFLSLFMLLVGLVRPFTRQAGLKRFLGTMTTSAGDTPLFSSHTMPLHMQEKSIDLTLIQLGQTSMNKADNLRHAKQSILQAAKDKKSGASLFILPECWNSPYGVQHFAKYAEDFGGVYDRIKAPLHKEVCVESASDAAEQQRALEKRWSVDGQGGRGVDIDDSCPSETLKMMSALAKELGIVLVGGSIPERVSTTGTLYNTASVFDEQGRLISLHRKLHLFDIDIPGKMTFQESKTLTAGDRVTVFECSLGRFGLAICYDLRFPEPATVAARLGAGALLYPGAFNTTTGPRSWELLQRARAADNQVYVVSCSPARPSPEQIEAGAYPTYGFSMVVDPWGQVVQSLDERENTLTCPLVRQTVVDGRTFVPTSRQRRFDVYADIANV